jgi:uncharacterized damage-inducible protein DinB
MKHFFSYNWQVRDEWFEVLKTIPQEELYKKRIGGVGSIAYTLFHVVDVEYAWICGDLQQKTLRIVDFKDLNTLDAIIDLSQQYRTEVEAFLNNWNPKTSKKRIAVYDDDGIKEVFAQGEILSHVIAHEIHHIGQLSVWAREMGIKPITANLIRRNIF